MSNEFSLKNSRRFAFARHEFSAPHQTESHFDLFLELEHALQTWRFQYPLGDQKNTKIYRIPDHRTIYLDFEGPVSGGRGELMQLMTGCLFWIRNDPSEVIVRLEGAAKHFTYRFHKPNQFPMAEDSHEIWHVEMLDGPLP